MPKGVYIRTEETKRNMSIARLKRKERLGYLNSPEARKKQGKAISGANNPNWKEDDIGYFGIHTRIRKIKSIPEICDICHQKTDKNGSTRLELSNTKNHKYTDNPDDYQYVHYGCHRKYDAKKRKTK